MIMDSWGVLRWHIQCMVTWCWKFISATEKNQTKGVTHSLEAEWLHWTRSGPCGCWHWASLRSLQPPSAGSSPLLFHPPSLSFHHSLFYISHSHTISSASPKYIKQLLCLLFWRKGLDHIGKAGLDHISLLPGTPECWEEKPCVCQHAQHKWALPVLNVGSISVHVSPFFQAFSHIWV